MADRTTDWRERLTPERYAVLREQATEAPFTGEFDQHWEEGAYRCGGCGQELFSSDQKFDAGCGWPSFSEALPGTVEFRQDDSHGMRRTEAVCSKCGGHLGHVFDDGPRPTGKRYCINSLALNFSPDGERR